MTNTSSVTQAQITALRFGMAMRETQATAALGARLAGQAAVNDVLLEEAASGGVSRAAASFLPTVIASQGIAADRTALSESLQSGALELWRDAMASGGPVLAALSSQQIVASPSRPGGSPASLTLCIGKLYLLKLRSLATVNDLPPLEGDFEWSKHTNDLSAQPGATEAAPARLKYLGLLRRHI
jgi:hypothetical protein